MPCRCGFVSEQICRNEYLLQVAARQSQTQGLCWCHFVAFNATNWTITAGIEQVPFIMQVESTSPAERGLLAELDFFFPACPSALMLSFSAATNGHLDHFDGGQRLG
jgi:hypothetical protein